MAYPLGTLDMEQQENVDLLTKSINHWLDVDDGRQIYGWSQAAASCMSSLMGDGDAALESLIKHHQDKRFVMPNTMYIEGSPVIECSLFAARSLQDMLLQSSGNLIRVFPAVPSSWNDTSFQNLRTEGSLPDQWNLEGWDSWLGAHQEPCRRTMSFDASLFRRGDGGSIRSKDQDGFDRCPGSGA